MVSPKLRRSVWKQTYEISDARIRMQAQAALVKLLPSDERRARWWSLLEACEGASDTFSAEVASALLREPNDDDAIGDTLEWARAHISTPVELVRVAVATGAAFDNDMVQEAIFEMAEAAVAESIRLGFLLALEPRLMRGRPLRRWLQLAKSLSSPKLSAIAALELAKNQWRAGQKWALSAAECVDDGLRNEIHLAVETARWDGAGSGLTASRAMRNMDIADTERRMEAQLTCLHFAADDGTLRRVVDDVISQLALLDDPAVRLHYLEQIAIRLPGGLPGPWPDALRLVEQIPSERLRAKGLTSLLVIYTWESDEVSVILEEAEKLNDPWAKAEVLFAFGTRPPPGVTNAQWIDRLVAALRAVDDPGPVARMGARALVDPSVFGTGIEEIAVRAAFVMDDGWPKVRTIEALMHVGAGDSDLLEAAWDATSAISDIGKRAMARGKLSRYLGQYVHETRVTQTFAELLHSGEALTIARWTRRVVNASALDWWEGPDA